MKTIRLYGDLKEFNPEWKLHVDTVAESLRAIEANRPGFLDKADSADYVLILLDEANPNNTRQVTKANAQGAWTDEILLVVPKPSGEYGIGEFIVSALFTAAFAASTAGAVVAAVIEIALVVAISVVASLISGTNSGMTAGEQEAPENKPSYLMNGVVNTLRQGHPIPLLYGGPLLVGSMVLSADIHVEAVKV
jgi:predicted phage tail protein